MQPKRSPATGSSRPLAELDVRDPVQGEVEGDGERARVDVRRDHFAGVAREQERLDPVAGADVERPLDLPDRQVREHRGRAVHAGDAVGPSTSSRSDAIRRSSCGTTRTSPRSDPSRSSATPASTSSGASSFAATRRRGAGGRSEREAVRLGREPAPVDLQVTCVKIGSPLVCRRRAILAGVVAAASASRSRAAAPPRRGGRRLQILTFLDRSQPLWTGASREPSPSAARSRRRA